MNTDDTHDSPKERRQPEPAARATRLPVREACSGICAIAVLAALCLVTGCGDGQSLDSSSEKVYRIGFGFFGPDVAVDNTIVGYLAALKEEGFEEGRNLEVLRMHAFGEIAQLPQTMRTLEAKGLDVIAPMTTPGLTAALKAVTGTPMVFVHTYDPFGAGVGNSFEDHLPNVTGVASFAPIEGTMDAILEVLPGTRKIGTLYNASEANSQKAVGVARKALQARGVELEEITIGGTGDVFQSAQALVSRSPDAVWVTGDNTVLLALEGVIKVSRAAGIPVIVNDPEAVGRGALFGVGISWFESGFEAGKMAARVLRGESPAGIPIVQIARRRLVLNHEVAREMGITFPASLLEEAVSSKE